MRFLFLSPSPFNTITFFFSFFNVQSWDTLWFERYCSNITYKGNCYIMLDLNILIKLYHLISCIVLALTRAAPTGYINYVLMCQTKLDF
jgi:hypothetical protein